MTGKTPHEPSVPDRRMLLKGGLLAGLGAAVAGIASPALTGSGRAAATRLAAVAGSKAGTRLTAADAAFSSQDGWAWCHKCQGLFFRMQESFSKCPAGGPHEDAGSYNYTLLYDLSVSMGGVQVQWAWCNKCRSLFFGMNQNSKFCWCPKGGPHNGAGSFNYFLYYDQGLSEVPHQPSWAWCWKCQSLFYGPHQSSSWCPAVADTHHDGSRSYNYDILVEST